MRLEYYYAAGQTLIPNVFIDKYMTEASGEFVKVYLCLLRMQGAAEITAELLADRLDLSERTVDRALSYLEKCGLLKLFYDEQGKMNGIRLLPGTEPAQAKAPAEEAVKAAPAETRTEPSSRARREKSAGGAEEEGKRRHYQPTEVGRLCEQDPEFNMLVSVVAPAYLERVLTHRDNELLAYLHHELKLPVDVLEYCIEQCVERKKDDRSRPQFMRYIETVALSWHKEGVLDLEGARQAVRRFDEKIAEQKDAGAKAGTKKPGDAGSRAAQGKAAGKAVTRSPKIQAAYGFSTERGDVDYNALAWSRMWEEK